MDRQISCKKKIGSSSTLEGDFELFRPREGRIYLRKSVLSLKTGINVNFWIILVHNPFMQCKIYILEHNPPQTKLFFVPVKRLLNNYFIEIGSKSQRVTGMYIRALIEDGYREGLVFRIIYNL